MIVTIAGNPSGIAATAREIAVSSMSNKLSRPVPMPIAKIATAIANTKPDKTLLKWVMLFWSGVTVGLALLSRLAIWPTSVAAPVATTIPVAVPAVTLVFIKPMLC